MSVRMRHTRAHTRNRRSHHALGEASLSTADGVPHLRHRASAVTGMYRGRKVLNTAQKVEKKLAQTSESKKESK